MLGDIGGRQHHPLPQHPPVRTSAQQRDDVEAAVLPDAGHPVRLPVDRAAPVALDPGEVPPVEPGLDEVAHPGDRALRREGHAVLGDAAEPDELGAQLGRQAGGLLVGVDEQQRAASGEGVAEPRARGGLLGLLAGACVEQAALLVIGTQHLRVAVAQP